MTVPHWWQSVNCRFAHFVVLVAALLGEVGVASGTSPADCCDAASSWIFLPGRYSHDPFSGARVAQYAEPEPVEPLPDPRLVTSGYQRSRWVLRGPDGNNDTYYEVRSFANGQGGLDAEWERFHDAWRQSTTSGGYDQFSRGPAYGYGPPRAYGRYDDPYLDDGYGGRFRPEGPYRDPYRYRDPRGYPGRPQRYEY